MPRRSPRGLAWTILALLAAGACARTSPRAGSILESEHVRVRLISDAQALIPGSRQQIGVLFTPEPGWHLYGPSRNDSGLPILLHPLAPAGFTFHPPLWPAPHRLISAGRILDHIYPGEVTIVLPLDVPASARPGERATLRCHAEWLVCGTGCIPGQGELQLDLPIGRPGATASRSPDDGYIRAALVRVPQAQELLGPSTVSSWSHDAWTVTVPGAQALSFYPDTTCAPLLDPVDDAVSSSNRLSLRLATETSPEARISGILEVAQPDGSRLYRIDFPRPAG